MLLDNQSDQANAVKGFEEGDYNDDNDDDDDNDSSSSNGWAIVQASNFTTLFLLSRDQNPPSADIDRWLARAGRLGSNLTEVIRIDQSNC